MNLLKAASTVSLWTLASRVTGLVREWIVASQFGASAWTDAFHVAFRIPNLLRRLFAEGAFSQAFVPLLGEVQAREGDAVARDWVDAVATVLAAVLIGVCLVGVVGAPVLVWAMASGLVLYDEAVLMTRWMFPYIGCMGLVALCAGVLNTQRRFLVPAATPVLLNVAVIVAAWALAAPLQRWGIHPTYALCVGVMVGGVAQLGLQWWALARLSRAPRLAWRPSAFRQAWAHPGVGRVLRQMAPAILGVSVAQLSLLINTLIASHQGAGAVSWITYADRLMEFPTALLGVALGVVLLPALSAARARGEEQEASAMLDWGLRLVVVLALPCAAALIWFPQALVACLFHYGAFGADDVRQTAAALTGYGAGLMGLVAIKVLAPGFYARQDIRTPVRIAVAVLVFTQLLNALLVPRLGAAGLAWSIGLAALANAAGLLWGLWRSGGWSPGVGWVGFLVRVFAGNAVLAGVLQQCAQRIDWLGLQDQAMVRLLLLAACIMGAGVAYGACLWLSGVRPAQFRRRAAS